MKVFESVPRMMVFAGAGVAARLAVEYAGRIKKRVCIYWELRSAGGFNADDFYRYADNPPSNRTSSKAKRFDGLEGLDVFGRE